jgi:hypothetical protein
MAALFFSERIGINVQSDVGFVALDYQLAMRLSFFILGVFAAVLCMEGPAKAAHYYPWCEYAKIAGSGNPKCQFATLEQCVTDVFPVGGNCGPSPYHPPKSHPSIRRR